MTTNKETISSYELDQLKEVVNIGASHASTALSRMLGKTVLITVPEAIVDSVEEVAKFLGKDKGMVTAVILKIMGDAPGIMAYFFQDDDSNRLARLITKDESSKSTELNDFEKSALEEVGNILSGAFFAAFSKFLDIYIMHSISEVVQDSFDTIMNSVIAEMAKSTNMSLVFKIKFIIEGTDIESELSFLIDPYTTAKILEKTSGITK